MAEKKDFTEDIILKEISIAARYIDPLSRYPFHIQKRKHYGLLYTVKGKETYKIEKEKAFTTVPENVFFLPKDAEYHVTLDDEVCEVICIDFETAVPFDISTFIIRPQSKSFANLFAKIEYCWRTKAEGYRLECLSIFYHILAEVKKQITLPYSPMTKRDKIAAAVEYLHENYCEKDIGLEKIAKKCGLHPRYFARLFREIYGVSPHRYIIQLRMEYARELLLCNRYSVSMISEMTGYGDIYTFSKVFSRENGVSPTKYGEA